MGLTDLAPRWISWRIEGSGFARVVRCVFNAGIVLALFLLTMTCMANTMTGLVIGVADGDTLTLLDEGHVQHKIRLAGIDAPEKRQAFGNSSRQHLAKLVFRRQVTVEWTKFDRYRRVIGRVLLSGDDVCLEQVRAGFAWHYKAYELEQSATDRELYAKAELDARENKRGLWRDILPVPPWDFRHP